MTEEVLDCHCHYNGHDRRGRSWSSDTPPKILVKISPELSKIRIASQRPQLDLISFAQKVFYIDGINKGLNPGGQISADANRPMAQILQRVKSHILRPLWWSTNVSNFNHSALKICRNIADGIVAGYFGVLNALKDEFNWISGSSYFKVTSKNADSEDYNNTAFDFAQEINELIPLDAEQVKEKNCEIDVVTILEDFVAKRPTRPGFFAGISDKPVNVSEEQDIDLRVGYN